MTTANLAEPQDLFDLTGRVAVITGGTGVLGGVMVAGLAQAGVRVAVLGRRSDKAAAVVAAVAAAGGEALATPGDVLDVQSLKRARDAVLERWQRIDILVNAAGGNMPDATIAPEQSFFAMPDGAFETVLALNLTGTVNACRIFGAVMAERDRGSIVNISSLAADRPITRVAGYAAAKAGVANFTSWLAVELAQKHGEGLRVNAIAPGFFLGEQNRALLLNNDGSYTERGSLVIDHTPMGRFALPEELLGALYFLCSDASAFVTGTTLVVDGGFSAYHGL